MQTKRLLILVGGLILVLGARLPWMSVPVLFGVQGPEYESIEIGWEDNGLITGGIGLILFLGGLVWKGRAKAGYSIPAAILSAWAVVVVIGCFQKILELDPSAGFFAATAIGIYLTFVGALLSLIGTVGSVILSFSDGHRHTPQSARAA